MEQPSRLRRAPDGLVAEWLRRGLQILAPRFDSGEASIPTLRHFMVDFTQARRTMVDSQLRTFDVNDISLLDAMDDVPREHFVLPGREQLAYSDLELPVSEGADRRFMLSPMVLARLIQALEIDGGDQVLDVASGRGYSSAVLSELGAYVTALEADGLSLRPPAAL